MLLNPFSSDLVLTNVHGYTLLKKFFSAVIVEVKCQGGDICNLGGSSCQKLLTSDSSHCDS